MSVTGFIRLIDPTHPAVLFTDILFWSIGIILFVFSIVVLLIGRYK